MLHLLNPLEADSVDLGFFSSFFGFAFVYNDMVEYAVSFEFEYFCNSVRSFLMYL